MAIKISTKEAKSILQKHQTKDDRKKVSLYLSKKLYEQFKRSCKDASASAIMEELMTAYIQAINK